MVNIGAKIEIFRWDRFRNGVPLAISKDCYGLVNAKAANSGADSIGHWGTCPHYNKWLGTGGGTVSGRTARKEADQTLLTITKALTKTTNCT